MSIFKQVGDFHRKFGLPVVDESRFGGDSALDRVPALIDRETFNFRYHFLLEELEELAGAFDEGDLPGVADALADLIYVALGTAHYFGVPFDAVFAEVQRANLAKKRATSPEQSKRGSTLDVVKPAGWVGPDVEGVLRKAGWEGSKK